MKVLMWVMYNRKGKVIFDSIVLWDGANTYWNDDMMPSHGYEKEPWREPIDRVMGSKFYLIGEL